MRSPMGTRSCANTPPLRSKPGVSVVARMVPFGAYETSALVAVICRASAPTMTSDVPANRRHVVEASTLNAGTVWRVVSVSLSRVAEMDENVW